MWDKACFSMRLLVSALHWWGPQKQSTLSAFYSSTTNQVSHTTNCLCEFLVNGEHLAFYQCVSILYLAHQPRLVFENWHWCPSSTMVLPWTKKKKKKNHPRDSRREEHCSISWYHAWSRAMSAGQGHPRLLPCADRAWSSTITHVEQRSSCCESPGWFFFLSRVVLFGTCCSSNFWAVFPADRLKIAV